MVANGRVGLMMNVSKNKLDEVINILPKDKKPTISELTDPNWIALISIWKKI